MNVRGKDVAPLGPVEDSSQHRPVVFPPVRIDISTPLYAHSS